jgi:hypothetical protein
MIHQAKRAAKLFWGDNVDTTMIQRDHEDSKDHKEMYQITEGNAIVGYVYCCRAYADVYRNRGWGHMARYR